MKLEDLIEFNRCPKGHTLHASPHFLRVRIANYFNNVNHAEMMLECDHEECNRYYLVRDCHIVEKFKKYHPHYFNKGILTFEEIPELTQEQDIEYLKSEPPISLLVELTK